MAQREYSLTKWVVMWFGNALNAAKMIQMYRNHAYMTVAHVVCISRQYVNKAPSRQQLLQQHRWCPSVPTQSWIYSPHLA